MMAILIACSAPLAFAQSTSDYNKVDVYVGYSNNRVDVGETNEDPELDDVFDEREGFHGFNTSVTGNISRYVGIKGDYSFHRKSFTVAGGPTGTVDADTNLHNLVGGVQFKDNSPEAKVKPFAHLMAGISHARFDVVAGASSFEESDTGFSGIIGGGVDFRVSPRVDIRAIQFDYNPTRLNDGTQHNFRIGFGVVFR
jgi:opacity protein-like surface antigen